MAGVIVGFLFDFYRSLRKWLGWGNLATIIGDILFSLASLGLFFRFFLKANALDFRFYMLWGSVLGLFVYFQFLSRIFIWSFFKVFELIETILWLIREGIKIPVKGLILLMRPPYTILRWFSLLIFRILEAFLVDPLEKLKRNILNVWNRFFPPHTHM